MELPDFSDDPIVADDASSEIEFRLQNPWVKVAAAYPSEVTFVPMQWKIPSKSH
jgi:hypothetical protein